MNEFVHSHQESLAVEEIPDLLNIDISLEGKESHLTFHHLYRLVRVNLESVVTVAKMRELYLTSKEM